MKGRINIDYSKSLLLLTLLKSHFMTDVFTREKRSWVMSRIKGKHTKLEMVLEKELKRNKIRFKKYPKLFGKPDFLINNDIAVFIDGCFWHKCPKHYSEPKSRKDFWLPKIDKNVIRDKEVTRRLKKDGYIILRFWGHDIKRQSDRCIEKILDKMK